MRRHMGEDAIKTAIKRAILRVFMLSVLAVLLSSLPILPILPSIPVHSPSSEGVHASATAAAYAGASFLPVASAQSFSSIVITDVRPTTLYPGETAEVTIVVKNNGGRDARDIRLEFQGTPQLSVVGATVAHINTLPEWSEKEVKVTVHVADDTPNGVYAIPIICSWKERYLVNFSVGYVTEPKPPVQLGISFNVIGSPVINVGAVSTEPPDIRPGDENVKLTVSIENSGEGDAKDVEAFLLLNSTFKPSWSGTERSYIGKLRMGDAKNAIFHIDVADNASSKNYKIPIRIRYKDSLENEHEVLRYIDVLVEPKPNFDIVDAWTSPKNVSVGAEGVKLFVKLRNTGSEKAEAVSVRAVGEADVPFDYAVKSGYVGDLEVGEEGVAVLEFDVDEDATPKTYLQRIEIRCTGDRELSDENTYIFLKRVELRISGGGKKEGKLPGYEFALASLSLLLTLAVWKRKCRR